MQKRLVAIDFLRAVGILGVIATHVFSDNLTTPSNVFIWNYLHFVITSFVFCSGYVMYLFYQEQVNSFGNTLLWYKKRLLRLLKPYYIYLLVHIGLVVLLPLYFTGLGIQRNWQYLLQSIFLTGGINENWLPLLFVELALLFPLLLYLLKKHRVIFGFLITGGIAYTVWITIFPAPYAIYRWVMWIPWSVVFVLSWYFAHLVSSGEKGTATKTYGGISVLSSIVFAGLYWWFSTVHRSLVLIDNKYPPNLFYLSFEFAMSFALLTLASWRFLQEKWLVTLYTFLSSRSYGLFFVHFIFLDLLLQVNRLYHLGLSAALEVVLVTGVSIAAILLWEKALRLRGK